MARFGSADPFPVAPGAPRPQNVITITVETVNPDIIARVKELLGTTEPLDQDLDGNLWETYVEVTQTNPGSQVTTHIWSSAYEPDEVD